MYIKIDPSRSWHKQGESQDTSFGSNLKSIYIFPRTGIRGWNLESQIWSKVETYLMLNGLFTYWKVSGQWHFHKKEVTLSLKHTPDTPTSMSDHPLVPKHNPCPMKRREKENIVLSNNKISKRYDDFVIAHNMLNHFSFVAENITSIYNSNIIWWILYHGAIMKD